MNNQGQTHKKSLIFLTGFMGSGKSTVGPILANTIGFEYLDVDKCIERRAGKKVVDIFQSDGEAVFRTHEQTMLRELAARRQCVIALGGGTIANEENFHLVSRNGVLIYLKLSPEEILQRVQHRNDRPMLKDADGKLLAPPELERRIRELLAHREPYYSRADIVIEADALRVGVTVDEIVKHLRGLIGKE